MTLEEITGSVDVNLIIADLLLINGGSTLSVFDGAAVTANSLSLGTGSTGVGEISVEGSQSRLDLLGAGTHSIGDGGAVGQLFVFFDATATFGAAGMIEVGVSSNNSTIGILGVGSGGTISLGSLAIGTNTSDATGDVSVTDAGSSITQAGNSTLTIGSASGGAGTLSVFEGTFTSGTGATTLNATGIINVNNGTFNANGSLTMVAGSTLTFDGGSFNASAGLDNSVGGTLNFLDGTLTVTGGAFVPNAGGPADDFRIDGPTVAELPHLVIGASATANTGGVLRVGRVSRGELTIADGGSVSSRVASIGGSASSTGTVTVVGEDSTWMISNGLIVGSLGNATLNIQNGGVVSSDFGLMGVGVGSTGAVTVDGPGSIWTISSAMNVGHLGAGTLNIQNGGTVSTGGASISNSASTATVEGDDGFGNPSTWTNSNVLTVNGTLDVLQGGTVFSNGSSIGSSVLQPGAVTIDGAGSTWTNIGQLTLARLGPGSLTITDNAAVTTGSAVIGESVGGTGNLTVTNGLFDNTFSMFVGGSTVAAGGQGTLTVETQGLVDVGFTLTVWGPGVVQLNGGTLQAINVVMNGGTFDFNSGMLNYTQNLAAAPGDELSEVLGPARTIGAGRILKVDGNMTVAPLTTVTLTGGQLNTGGLTHEGELLASAGTSQVFGPVDLIGSGRVEANGGNLQFNGTVDHNGADIQVAGGNQVVFAVDVTGAGNFSGAGLIRFESVYSAGNSPAEVSFGGDIEFGPGSNLPIEIGGTNAGANTDFDRLLVDGAVTLDGTLAISLINSFRQAINSSNAFVVMETGDGISGNWANIANGQRIGLTNGTVDFLVSYGAGSAFDPTQLVLSDFSLSIFEATLAGSGDWTTVNWDFEPATPVPPDFPNDDFDFAYHAIVNSGTVTLDRPITISGLTLSGTITAISGNGLTLRGPGDWNSGTLGGDGSFTIANGATLTLSGTAGSKTFGNGIAPGSTTLVNNGTIFHSGDDLNLTGDSAGDPGTLLENHGIYNVTDNADFAINPSDVVLPRFENKTTGVFNKSGVGTTTRLNIPFNNSGTVNVDSGTLQLNNFNQLVGGTLTAGIYAVQDGAALELTSDITTNTSTVILRGAASSFARFDPLANNQGRFEIHDGRNFDTLGDLANAGQIVIGAGSTLTVNGTYMQTGPTSSIDVAGVLDVTAGTPTIADGATLSGEGVLTGPIEIGLGGIVSPGTSPGTLTTADLTLADGAIYQWELGPTASDLLSVEGTLAFGSDATLAMVDLGGMPDPLTEYTLFTYTGADPTSPIWTIDTSGASDWDVSSLVVSVDTVGNRVFLSELDVAIGLAADFDEDGDVDGDDFLAWQSGFGTNIGAMHSDGDADADGDVDGDDFLLWQSQFGSAAGDGAMPPVPEPISAALFIFATTAMSTFANRRDGRRGR